MHVIFKPSSVRELYDRIAHLRQEASPDSDFDRRFHGIVRDDLHRLRALCDEKKNCIEMTGTQIAALERLQPHINDLQPSVNNKDRTGAVRVIGEHQGALSDEISKAKAGLPKCEEKIAQCEKEVPEDVKRWEEKRVRKIAKCLLLEEAKKSSSADRSKCTALQAALSSYDCEINKIEIKQAEHNSLSNRVLDPLVKGSALNELRLARGMKDDISSHIDFLSKRFDVFIKLTEHIQANKWAEASESLHVITRNHYEAIVMMRKICLGAQAEFQKHDAMMQTSLKADKLFQMIRSQKLPEDETLAEWIPKWVEIEGAYRSYSSKASA